MREVMPEIFLEGQNSPEASKNPVGAAFRVGSMKPAVMEGGTPVVSQLQQSWSDTSRVS